MPDTITTWLVKAVALHSDRGLGVSDDFAKLRVFQPFFVSMQLPYSVVRNEVLHLQVSVFNYNDDSQQVEVKLEFENNETFELAGQQNDGQPRPLQNPSTKRVTVPAQAGATVTFAIRARRVGELLLTATARRVTSGLQQLADVEKRNLKVIAEGKTVYYNIALFVDMRNQSGERKQFPSIQILIPRESHNFVRDSEHAEVAVTGDVLAPTIRGLSDLVRMPYGCGEQNMINFVPNILVLQYLTVINRLTIALNTTSMEYVRMGYQRELDYRHADGSYSAFGQRDHSGSTWLTAFVLKSFAMAAQSRFVALDSKATSQSLHWLIQQQRNDGIFGENGNVIHKHMQGGGSVVADALNIPLTAYALIALTQTRQVSRATIRRSASYLLSQRAAYADEPYSLAVCVYALHLAASEERLNVLNALERMQQRDSQGRVFWTATTQSQLSMEGQAKLGFFYKPSPVDVEMTAYVLLTYAFERKVEKALPVARWLLAQRNERGGFTSTQDTVIALEALSRFAALVYESQLGKIFLSSIQTGKCPKFCVCRKSSARNRNFLSTSWKQTRIRKVRDRQRRDNAVLMQMSDFVRHNFCCLRN